MHTNASIEQAVAEGKPFFVNLWVHEPHTPFHTVQKYEWRFREMEEESRPDQIYASVLSHADDRIGEVLDTLDRLDVAENTLVLFKLRQRADASVQARGIEVILRYRDWRGVEHQCCQRHYCRP